MAEWDAKTAEWYAEKYGDYPTNQLGIEALTLPPTATVVDVGCGTGSALRQAAQQVTSGRLIGIDPVPRMVEIAREQTASHPAAQRIQFEVGTAEKLPLEDRMADFVLAFDSFDHWQNQAQGLAEVRRVLRAEGEFVVVKDGGLPGGKKARQAFANALAQAGFDMVAEQSIQKEDVTFTLWRCVVTD